LIHTQNPLIEFIPISSLVAGSEMKNPFGSFP
jgi:hypothetical protein